MRDVFDHDHFLIRRKVFKLFGAAFHLYDDRGNVIGYSKQKAFKLRESIRLYTDESMSTELLSIQARNIIDFSAVYDVFDPLEGQVVGSVRRHGLKSMLRDKWVVLDPQGNELCVLEEESMFKAIARRFVDGVAMFMPQKYIGKAGEKQVCHFRQNFNPFVQKINLDYSFDHDDLLDRRLGLAAAVLLCAIEGRQ